MEDRYVEGAGKALEVPYSYFGMSLRFIALLNISPTSDRLVAAGSKL
jgi:hypothetical protein